MRPWQIYNPVVLGSFQGLLLLHHSPTHKHWFSPWNSVLLSFVIPMCGWQSAMLTTWVGGYELRQVTLEQWFFSLGTQRFAREWGLADALWGGNHCRSLTVGWHSGRAWRRLWNHTNLACWRHLNPAQPFTTFMTLSKLIKHSELYLKNGDGDSYFEKLL